MAYDLLLRRQISFNIARDTPDTSPKTLGMITMGLFTTILFLPKIFRSGEVHYYKRKLADPQSRITREIPIVSMYEMAGALKYPRRSSQA